MKSTIKTPVLLVSILSLCYNAAAIDCTNAGTLDKSNGGRKIAFVIDNSNSMLTSDRDNIRLKTAKTINDGLVTAATATEGKTADLVAVVQFSDDTEEDTKLIYPLGDPSGADAKIDEISFPIGGTSISAGIRLALDKLTKTGGDSVAGKAGIVVFTDGVDDNGIKEEYPSLVKKTVEQINRARDLGVRVSFAFLEGEKTQESSVMDALVKTGGVPGIIKQADEISRIPLLFFNHGLVGAYEPSAKVLAVPNIVTVSILQETGPNTFTYSAKAGETFNITVNGAYDRIPMKITLNDGEGKELKSAEFEEAAGATFVDYAPKFDVDVEIVVQGHGGASGGLFYLTLKSTRDPCEAATIPSTPSVSQVPKSAATGDFQWQNGIIAEALLLLMIWALI